MGKPTKGKLNEKLPQSLDEFLGLTDTDSSSSSSGHRKHTSKSPKTSSSKSAVATSRPAAAARNLTTTASDEDSGGGSSSNTVLLSKADRLRFLQEKRLNRHNNTQHKQVQQPAPVAAPARYDGDDYDDENTNNSEAQPPSSIHGKAHSVLSDSSSSYSNIQNKPKSWLKSSTSDPTSATAADLKEIVIKPASKALRGPLPSCAPPLVESDADLSSMASMIEHTLPHPTSHPLPTVPGQQILDTQTAENSFEFNTTEDDKQKFFANLEQDKGDKVLDYEALNAQLDEQTEPEIPKDILDEIDRINNIDNSDSIYKGKQEEEGEASSLSQVSSLSPSAASHTNLNPLPPQQAAVEESKRQKNDHDTAPSSVSDFDVSTHQIEGGQQTNDNNNYSVSSFEDISTSANNNNNNDLDQTSLLSEPVAQGITEISGGGGGGGDGGVGASANDSTFLTGGKDASPMAELELFEREFVNNSFSSVESHSFGLPSSSKEVLSGIPVTQNLFMIEDSNSVKESQKLEQIAKLSTTALITTPSLSSTQQQPIEKSSYVQQPLTSTKDYTINFSTTKHTESQQHHTKDELDFLEFKRVQEKEDKKQQYRFNMLQISDLGIEDLRKTMEDQERLIRGYQIENEKLTDQLKMTKKASGEAERRFFFKQEQLQKEIGTLKTYLAGRDSANNGESLDVAKMQVEIETLKEERDVLIRRAEEREVVMKGEVVKLNALLHEAEEHLRRERVEASSRFSISKEEYGKMVDSYENRILEMSLELDSLTTNNGGVGQSDLGAATYSSSRPKKVGSKLSNKRGAASADTNTSSQELQQKISSLKRMLDNQKIEYEEKLQFVRDEHDSVKKSYEKAERELVVKLQEVQAYHRQSTTSINNDNNNNNNKIQSSITDSKSNEALVARLLELEQQFTRFKEQPHLWTAHGDERTFQEQLISAQQGLKTALERNLDIEKLLAEYSEQIDRLREQRRRLETDYAKLVKSSEESSKESDIAILNLKEQVKKNSFAVDQLTVISQLQSTVRELKQENADLSTRLEVAESTKHAVHQNTLQLLRNAQEESSKIALHHQAKALEILRQESSAHHLSIFEQETRLLRKRALDAEEQLRKATLQIQELEARCAELEEIEFGQQNQGGSGGKECMSCGIVIQELETRNRGLEEKVNRLMASADPQSLHLDEIVSRIHLLEEKYMRKEVGFIDQLHAIEARARQDMALVKTRHEEALRSKDVKIANFQRELDSLNALLIEVKSRIKLK